MKNYFVHHLSAVTGIYYLLNYCFSSLNSFHSYNVVEHVGSLMLMEIEYLDWKCENPIQSSILLNVSTRSKTFPFAEISLEDELPGGFLTISPWKTLGSNCSVPPRSVHFQSGCSMSTMYSCEFLSNGKVKLLTRTYDSNDPNCFKPSLSLSFTTFSPTRCSPEIEVFYGCSKLPYKDDFRSLSRSVDGHQKQHLTQDYTLDINFLLEFAQTRKTTFLQSHWDLNNPSAFCSWWGVGCDSEGHINHIAFGWENLGGTIPSSLGLLTRLDFLDLPANRLTGSIPTSLGDLIHLHYFYLDYNQLTGTIPSSLGALTHVDTLNFLSNNLTGTLPSSFGGLISLAKLDVSKNFLTGTIPTSFGLMKNALFIYLQGNRLQGSIPASLGTIPDLRNLYLYWNNFTSLPGAIFPNLLNFRVQGNRHMKGMVYQNISEIGLVTLRLGVSHLSCYSPQLLVPDQDFFNTLPLCYDDTEMVLYDLERNLDIQNRLSSVVNDIQGEWNTDHPFDSTDYSLYNPFRQTYSIEIPGAYQFQVKIDRHSMLSGSGFLRFHATHIHSNSIIINKINHSPLKDKSSSISLFNTKSDFHFNLTSADDDSGGFPNNDDSTQSFSISDCFTPSTHTQLIIIDNPNVLEFSFQTNPYPDCPSSSWGARFTFVAKANIPNIGWDFTLDPQTNQWRAASDYCNWFGITCEKYSHRVTSINLAGYNLRGSLPTSIGLLSYLQTLQLSSNLMTSTLPTSIYQLSNLVTLDLSKNSFSGYLRDVFDATGFPSLIKVDLSVNNLQGTLPYSLFELPQIESIDLSSNQLTGYLRDFPLPGSALYSVLLDSNQFEGSIEGLCSYWSVNPSTSLSMTHNSELTCFEPCLQTLTTSQFLVDSSLSYCAPTSSPTSQPTSPTSMPTQSSNLRFVYSKGQSTLSNRILVGGSVGGFVFLTVLFGLGLYYLRSYQSPADRARKAKLNTLPVHLAILNANTRVKSHQIQPESSLMEVLKADEKFRTFVELDYDGRTAFDCVLSCLKSDPLYPLSSEFVAELLLMSFSSTDSKPDDWLSAVQSTHHVIVGAVVLVLDRERGKVKELAFAKDSTGRVCRDLASSQCRKEINARLFLGGRFDVVNISPEHKSATSMLILCMDRLNEMSTNNMNEADDVETRSQKLLNSNSESQQVLRSHSRVTMTSTRVALKFMMNQDQFEREVKIRAEGRFDSKHILGIQNSYSPMSEPNFYEDSVHKGFGKEYPYCILMEAANGDLDRMISDHNFAGEDFDEVRLIISELFHALEHLHSKGYIHGDLKPKNVVLTETSFKLIDLDASVRIGDFAGVKYSSAYLPPEMFYERDSQINVRVPGTSNLPEEELIRASPSFDIWSLGAILYLLSTKLTLFHSTTEDNLNDRDDLEKVMYWTEEVKMKKLANVAEPLARNMISQILTFDPRKRSSISRLSAHPFLSGKQVVRMVGQEAEFDVFLSYRVWSDKLHVAYLYELLTTGGLKVWWDAKCLKDGENWEAGFCNGLVNSRIFVPLLSRNGLSNFSNLRTRQCVCDNVLLEHRLALELSAMGLLDGVFPVVIGDEIHGTEPTQMKITWGPGGWIPECQEICVDSVEANTCLHLSNQALGTPLHPNRTVLSVMDEMKKMQGALIDGEYNQKMFEAASRIKALCDLKKQAAHSRSNVLNIEFEPNTLRQNLFNSLKQFQDRPLKLTDIDELLESSFHF